MRVLLKALGCRLNEAELETWSRDFQTQGYQLTNNPSQADLVVINTCAVTQDAVRKSRKLIRRVHRDNSQAKLIVSGCYATLNAQSSDLPEGVDLLIDNQHKDRLVEIATQQLDLHVMPEISTEPGENPLLARGRQRAFVKIQDGCRYRCTFCIVTTARGEERSRSITDIINEINALHADGIQEVTLTGVHIGGYGSDIDSNLFALIDTVLKDTDIPRIRLGSVEPWDLPDNFWTLFDNPRFMPHLHLPLQSGADTVLRRMARRCHTDNFRNLVTQARQTVPNFNATTDIIVGFPGETDDEWQQTLDYVEEIGFSRLHIFSYSPRAGTKAATLPNPVDTEIKKPRSRELHQLGQRMSQSTMETYIGNSFPVLIENRSQLDNDIGGCWQGYTPNFLPVAIEQADDMQLENQIKQIQLVRISQDGSKIMGRLID